MANRDPGARQRIAVGEHPRRRIEERLLLRFPALLDLLTGALVKLRPRSRLRQAAIRRAARLSLEASNRRDHEATFMVYHRDCECIFPAQMASVGEPGVRGRSARIRWEARWRHEWGQFRYAPEELTDLGDRVLLVGRLEGSGVGSGAAVDTDWAVVLTLAPEGGGAIREQVFFDRSEAFRAVGLPE
jgi:ketosteroid isomerase-like protein